MPRPAPDTAVQQLSGGTKGIPKLIPRRQNDYVHNLVRNAEVRGLEPEFPRKR